MATLNWPLPVMRYRNRLDLRGRNVFDFSLVTAFLLVGFSIYEGLTASVTGALILGALAVVLMGLVWALIRQASSGLIAGLFVGLLFTTMALLVTLSGGRSVAALTALPMFIMVAVLLERGLRQLLWVVLAFLVPLVAILLYQLPGPFPIRFPSGWQHESIMAASLVLVFFALLAGRAYRTTMEQARQEADETAALWRREGRLAQLNEARFRDFANEAANILWETDHHSRLTFLSSGFETLFGRSIDRCLGRPATEVFAPDNPEGARGLFSASEGGRPLSFSRRPMAVGQGQNALQLLVSGRPYRDAEGNWTGYRGVIQDVTARARIRRELEYRARRDSLTGTFNRRAFLESLQYALARAAAAGDSLAVAFVDLDHFKQVNDRGGHAVGDEVLRGVASALNSGLDQEFTLGRLGGDEFCAFVVGPEMARLERLGKRLLASVTGYRLLRSGAAFGVGASIGIVWQYPVTVLDEDLWLLEADRAAYRAKDQGRGRVEIRCLPAAGEDGEPGNDQSS